MTGRLTTLDRDRVEHFMREYEQPCHDGDYPRGQVRLQERYGSQAFRRGVATALRKRVPGELQDPGGWASYVSPLKCYIRQDSEAQRAALGRRLETTRGHATERGRRVRMHGSHQLAPRTGTTPTASRKTKRRCDDISQRRSPLQLWAWVELNYRPHAYQACALTT